MFEFIKVSQESGVGTIVLNRPDVFNALNDDICYELQRAFKALADDQEVRVVVLTGEGRGFCSGQDIRAIKDMKGNPSEAIYRKYNPIIKLMRSMSKPVICKLNGIAAGAGCSLALACDIIIASEEAALVEAFVNIGLVLDSGSSFFLPRIVGSLKAFELATMATKISATEALSLGMVNKVVPASQLDDEVSKLTAFYVTAPTRAIGLIKELLNKSYNSSLDEMLTEEARRQDVAGGTDDFREGIAAFLDKRKPNFKGR
ncbi:MAG: enoyl-CoA hydratase-related protein [Cytophagaceae bacterium]